jgi:hypothetical protein
MALGSALYSRLATPLGSAFYDGLAPQGGTPPYTLWQVLTTSDDYTFGDDTTEQLDVQLRTVSNRRWPGEARRIYGTVHANMQDAPLSVTGFTVLRVRRIDKFQYQDPDTFWHVGGVYRVALQKT